MPTRPSRPLYTEQQFRADLATLGLEYDLRFEAGLPDAVFKIKAGSVHPDFTKGPSEPMARLNVARDRVNAWVEGGRQPFALPVQPNTSAGQGSYSAPPRPTPRTPEEARQHATASVEQAAAELRRRRQKQSPEEMRQDAAASFERASEKIRNKRKTAHPGVPDEPYTMPPVGNVRDWSDLNSSKSSKNPSKQELKNEGAVIKSWLKILSIPLWLFVITGSFLVIVLVITMQGYDSIILFGALAITGRVSWLLFSWFDRDVRRICPKCKQSKVLEKISDKFSHDQWHSHQSESGKGEDRHWVTRRDTKQFFDAHYRCDHCGHEFDRRYTKYYMNNPSFDDPLHMAIGVLRMIIGL